MGTVLELQKAFGVSQATLDRALGELRREGILESRQGSGIYVARRAAIRHVGVFLGHDVFDPGKGEFPLLMIRALRRVAEARGTVLRYYLPPSNSPPLEDQISSLKGDIAGRLVDGLIIWAVYSVSEEGLPIPAVALGALPGFTHVVQLDTVSMVKLAADALLRCGCRRIAMLKGGWPSRGDRVMRCLRDAAAAAGATVHPEWVLDLGGRSSQESAATGARQFEAIWRSRPEKPDGLISCDDYATTGALNVLQRLGGVAGRDLMVATHANRGSRLFDGAPVIRIEYDPDDVAAALLNGVDAMIDGRNGRRAAWIRPRVASEERSRT